MIDKLTNLIPLTPGGQKEVFTAETKNGTKVVLKKIKPSRDNLERTRREIRAASLINSSYVPNIIAHNCSDNNPDFIWLVEEFIPGETLRDVLNGGRVFSIREIVHFLEIMLSITIQTEANKLVHRDIKPENIMVGDDGDFYLIDYGIARHLDLESLTATENPYGLFTLGYASSEQFRNQKKHIDIRTDLFSIGVVCYEMIKGKNFYREGTKGDYVKIMSKLENQSLPPFILTGDTQFQLSTFIKMIGDHRRTRRPNSAQEAYDIFISLIDTLKLD